MLFKNDICNFQYVGHHDFDFTKKYNVISTCLFRMKNHYKNFKMYTDGLKRWLKEIYSLDRDLIMLVFIDEHIYKDNDVMKIINVNKRVCPILYSCQDYIANNYHLDAFGTFTRFFPLFDFPDNFANNVFIVDIDFNYLNFLRFKAIFKFNKSITVSSNISDFLKKGDNVHIYAGNMYFGNKKYDKKILTDFIKNADKLKNKGYYKKRLTAFGYGTDEIFMNTFIKKYSDFIYCEINYSPNWFIYDNLKEIYKNPNSSKYLKYLLGIHYKKETLHQMIKTIDAMFYYEDRKQSDKMKYIAKRFYLLIDYLIKNNIEWINMNQMKIISKYLRGIVISPIFYKIDLKTMKLVTIEKL
jgi:hypothetical protein